MSHLLADESSEDGNIEPNKDDMGDGIDEELHGYHTLDDDDNLGESMEPCRMNQESKAETNETQYDDTVNRLREILEPLMPAVDGEIRDFGDVEKVDSGKSAIQIRIASYAPLPVARIRFAQFMRLPLLWA
jgi:hypothetical protein